MRKATIFAPVALACLLAAGCGKDSDKKDDPKKDTRGGEVKKDGEQAAPEVKLVKLDLSKAGLSLTIEAPEGATAKQSLGAVRITAPNFDLAVAKGKEDLAKIKKKAQENDIAPLKQWIVDSEDILFYEAEGLGKSRFTIEMNKKVGDDWYYLTDFRGPYSRADVELMLKSARTLAAK